MVNSVCNKNPKHQDRKKKHQQQQQHGFDPIRALPESCQLYKAVKSNQ
jgi:hypothetical protein